MTVRGGGVPHVRMASIAVVKNGSAASELRCDAHHCIMVRVSRPPHTSMWTKFVHHTRAPLECRHPDHSKCAVVLEAVSRQGKSRRGGRDVATRKPFTANQWVQLPPGKGQPASRKRVLHVAVATPSLKRRQQVLKPRGSPDMSNAEAFVVTDAGAASTVPSLARNVDSTGVLERGKGTGWVAWEPERSHLRPRERAPETDRRLNNDPGPDRSLHPPGSAGNREHESERDRVGPGSETNK